MKEGKSVNLNNQYQQKHLNGHFSPFKFAKLFDPEASWDKNFSGIFWGTCPYRKICFPNIMIWIMVGRFFLISSTIVYGYYAMILKIDEEDFGGHGTLLEEGLFASFSIFLLSWILVYNLTHF
ncbi:hypothetical protein K2173_022875 [Erythroxylum novogranatense]|uniref:Uncharacterized protein n=1 Tax=Erythroxylum novogranatense TaxID=1862640 RepID=A0AAV8TY47_9ROSI|nr:hypothetical protein K2173_022875 [Erythroxylum novogranatense]